MRQHEKKENAVSPVIGVMLMLTITIIVAAVITGFAMDLSKESEKTPMALFEAEYVDGKFSLKHKGGDPIPLKNIQISFEQIGGTKNNEIFYFRSGADGDLLVRGQETSANPVVSTGDVIRVKTWPPIGPGATAAWTLTYTKTDGLVANGECFIQ